MWLIDTHTFKLHWCTNPEKETYAILSHVWNRKGEQSFQDLQSILQSTSGTPQEPLIAPTSPSPSPGFFDDQSPATNPLWVDERFSAKLRCFCAVARSHGYRYAWNDACCIDKTSSAELSEAINSMFAWYAHADVCFAFLHDVSHVEDPYAPESAFRRSEWFTRGWTLQELITPHLVIFLSQDWRMIGTKRTFGRLIEEITSIETAILIHSKKLDSASVAQRMSWASQRKTTRIEDEAYSLMGLFGIYLPTIYGEGRNAFLRLQEEIIRRIPDESVFAWGLCHSLNDAVDPWQSVPRVSRTPSLFRSSFDTSTNLLAPSPAMFARCHDLRPISEQLFAQRLGCQVPSEGKNLSVTSVGVRMWLPLVQPPSDHPLSGTNPDNILLAVLACETGNGHIVVLMLSRVEGAQDHFRLSEIPTGSVRVRIRTLAIPQTEIRALSPYPAPPAALRSAISYSSVLVYQSRRDLSPLNARSSASPDGQMYKSLCDRIPRRSRQAAVCAIELTPWTVSRLSQAGFSLKPSSGVIVLSPDDIKTLHIVGDHATYTLHVKSMYTVTEDPEPSLFGPPPTGTYDPSVTMVSSTTSRGSSQLPRVPPQRDGRRTVLPGTPISTQFVAGSIRRELVRQAAGGGDGERVVVELHEWFPPIPRARPHSPSRTDRGLDETRTNFYTMDITITLAGQT